MGLSDPRGVFGIHSVTPYNRNTGEFYGTMRVLASSSLALAGETVDLVGGSSKYPWAVEDGAITPELSLSFREYPNFLLELALGATATDNVAEASGDVSTPVNVFGSIINATTGVASVQAKVGLESDLKFTKYILKAVSATTVDVYAASNVDFQRGTNKIYENDGLKITALPLTVPDAGGVVDIPGFGLEIVGGSGIVAMTQGHTASFEVRPPNSASTVFDVGSNASVFPEFGAIIMAQKRSDKTMFEFDIFRMKLLGIPFNMEEKAWSTAEGTAKIIYDSAKDGVFSARHIIPNV